MSMNHVATYKKGEVIFVQGDPADCMYDIEAGSVGIFTDYDTKHRKEGTHFIVYNTEKSHFKAFSQTHYASPSSLPALSCAATILSPDTGPS